MKTFYSVSLTLLFVPLILIGCSNNNTQSTPSTAESPSNVENSTSVVKTSNQGEKASGQNREQNDLKQRTGLPYKPIQSTRDTLPLLVIMTNLEKNMTALQAGVWRGDYQTIRKAAKGLANHAKIPKREIRKIREILGKKGLKNFVAADKYWHKKAKELAEVAGQKNMDQVVNLTSELLQRCASCHITYREPLRDSPKWRQR